MRQLDNEFTKTSKIMGVIFNKLRTDRHFTLEDVADKGISTSQLSNFEQGKSKLSAPALFLALKNINVNASEFHYLCNQRFKQKDILLFDSGVTEAYMDNSIPRLKILLKSIETEMKLHPDKKKFRLDKIRIEATLYILDIDYEPSREDIAFLKNYLTSLDSWSIEDIRLFSQCLSFLALKTTISLTKSMINSANVASQLHHIKLTFIRTLLNVTDRFLELRAFEAARRCNDYLEKYGIHEYYMFEKATLVYNKAKLDYLYKGDDESLNIMKRCKEGMEFFGCQKTGLMIEQEIEEATEDWSEQLSQ